MLMLLINFRVLLIDQRKHYVTTLWNSATRNSVADDWNIVTKTPNLSHYEITNLMALRRVIVRYYTVY